MNDKFDIVNLYSKLYKAEPKEPNLVSVPTVRVMAISGEGNPNAEPFQKAVEALYSIAYGIKFMPKRGPVPEGFVDFKVSPLEALWSMKDGKEFDATRPEQWQWEAFLVVPGFVTQNLAQNSVSAMADKHPNPQYDNLHIKTLEEKQAVQIMHIGSYKNETSDIALMRSFMESHDLKPSSAHHEIYMSDPRRVAASRLKTILRQPVIKK